MSMMVVGIVVSVLGMVPKGLDDIMLEMEIERKIEIIRDTAFLRSARKLRRVLETCCHSDSSERPRFNDVVKNSRGVKSNNDSNNKLKVLHHHHCYYLYCTSPLFFFFIKILIEIKTTNISDQ